MDVADGQPRALRLYFDFAVRRCLHGRDQRLTGEIALETAKLLGRDYDYLISAVHGHVLGPLAMHAADQLAETRLGILQ